MASGCHAHKDSNLVAQSDAIEAAIQAAVREALLRHKQAGNPIATWVNGKVQWSAVQDIDLTEFEATAVPSTALEKPDS
jgi:hypothetical protein